MSYPKYTIERLTPMQNAGKLAAKFDLIVGPICIRECKLWRGEDKPPSVTGPFARIPTGKYVPVVTFTKQFAQKLLDVVDAELALTCPSWRLQNETA